MATIDWNQRYDTGDLPWDSGTPDAWLVQHVVGTSRRGRALDVGCGTGTNAIWLARKGFEVLGIDVSPRAIEQARQKLAGAEDEPPCRFEVLDFLIEELPEPRSFDLVFDRGCFHVFDEPEQRARFASRVAAALGPGGLWLSVIGSTEGPPREEGPPRRSLRDIALAIEPHLAIVEIVAVPFQPDSAETKAAWVCKSRRRAVPAQPSTKR